MASVRRLAGGRWEARISVGKDHLTGKYKYVSRTVEATGKREAQRKANRIEDDLREGRISHKPGTFGTLLDEWVALKERAGGSPATLRRDHQIIDNQLRRPLGDVDVTKITTRLLDTIYGDLLTRGGRCQRRPCRPPVYCGKPGHATRCQRKACRKDWVCPTHDGACKDSTPCDESPCEHGEPLSISTIVRCHTVVHAALEQAMAWDWIPRNPADRANPGHALVEEVTVPKGEDVILLLAEAEGIDKRLATYIALAIETGARRGAMHALRWSYWTGPMDNGLSEIRFPKVISLGERSKMVERPAARNKKGGRATLGPYATAALTAHHDTMFERAMSAEAALPEDAFMFSDDVLGQRCWHPDSTTRRFGEARLRSGISPTTRLHDMRHLMATQLLATPGISPKVVQERGGWSELHTMFKNYTHRLPLNDQAAAGVVDRLITTDD